MFVYSFPRNYVAAVFGLGRVTTGLNHGEAYAQLSDMEKNEPVSGHLNGDGSFTSEMDCPHKDIIIVRHALSSYNIGLTDALDSELTETGHEQARRTGKFLNDNFDLSEYTGFVSPFFRCLQTASYFKNVNFNVEPLISETGIHFPTDGVYVPQRKQDFPQYRWGDQDYFFQQDTPKDLLQRLLTAIEHLPQKSILVTHGTPTMVLVEMALGAHPENVPPWDNRIPNASVSYIREGTAVYVGRIPE